MLGVLADILIFLKNHRKFCKQTVETLIRRRVLQRRRLIWVCTYAFTISTLIAGSRFTGGQ